MTELISAKQYADKYGLERTNVLKLIREGRIPAIKIGNQWCIPADTPRPEDRRVKSGKYKNWRKKPEA
ncbi:MAG: excisionase family DNA-binding protein [Clostridiales bacterium]|nr:excisionase family DNA-binding protein [Clostridiales bacterium]